MDWSANGLIPGVHALNRGTTSTTPLPDHRKALAESVANWIEYLVYQKIYKILEYNVFKDTTDIFL